MVLVFVILLLTSLLLEGTVTTLPLVFVCLLCLLILKRKPFVFYLAFVFGLFLETMTVHHLGGIILYFLLFFYLVLLYQKKYEINSYPFVVVSSFAGSLIFLTIFGYGNIWLQSLLTSVVALLLFSILKKFITLNS